MYVVTVDGAWWKLNIYAINRASSDGKTGRKLKGKGKLNCKIYKKLPSTPIGENGGRLQARTQMIGGSWRQIRCYRWRGTSVGWGFMKASAISLMVCNFNQERASARILCTPAICFALKQIVFSKQTSTSLHTKNIKLLSRHECLLITWTNALLSVKKKNPMILHFMAQ